MTQDEFNEYGLYLSGLWPRWTLTDEQRAIWWHRLQYVTLYDARQAAGDAYADGRWKEPTLAEILAALKIVKRGNVQPTYENLPPEYIQRCANDEAEIDAALVKWTDADLAKAKADILDHEPELKPLAKLPAFGKWWKHLIWRRFVCNVVYVYPNGGDPQEIPVIEFWNRDRKLGPLAETAVPV